VPWYVPRALEGRAAHGRARARGSRGAFLACASALALTGCGGGERQDEDEPEGRFRVQVVRAEFPEQQKLAKRSILEIAVKNVDRKRIRNVAVTLKGLDRRKEDPDLADPERPIFVINGRRREFGNIPDAQAAAPAGQERPAYVDTWSLGTLAPGDTKVFRWDLTAVQAGPYRLSYLVSAGLDGKAVAVLPSGQRPEGVFTGNIEGEAPQARIAEDGKTVITE
jgi:hypothetical protein